MKNFTFIVKMAICLFINIQWMQAFDNSKESFPKEKNTGLPQIN